MNKVLRVSDGAFELVSQLSKELGLDKAKVATRVVRLGVQRHKALKSYKKKGAAK